MDEYTKETHKGMLARVQSTLSAALAIAKEHKLTDSKFVLSGTLPDGSLVELGNANFQIGWLELYWRWFGRTNGIRIQYRPRTKKVSDSTQWSSDGSYAGVGHIQVFYTQERNDPAYEFEFPALLKQVQGWKIIPRAEAVLLKR